MAKIMIDPGHGGSDPGAVGSKSKEKDNVLKVAKKLKTLLGKYGHTVKMTRSTDVFISLSQRANMANSWGADYFISLHNNAASSSATGFETFVYNGGVSQKTKQFQNAIHGKIAAYIGIHDRGKKRANFAVLRQTRMPAVLIEYAFITNNEDEKILIDKVNKLAEWTCDGIIDAVGGKVKSSKKKTTKPKKKTKINSKKSTGANLTVDGKWGNDTTRALQKVLKTTVDGILSDQLRNSVTNALYGTTASFGNGNRGSMVIKSLQRKLGGLTVDGLLGPATVKRLQQYLNMKIVDSKLSRPSAVVKELQRRLNAGTF